MREYDKLVRNKIPQIIEESGNKCEIEIVDNETLINYLYMKLVEETNELLVDRNIEEVVDVIEVAFAIGKLYGYDEEGIMWLRETKVRDKGGFDENIILKKVYKDNNK